MSFIDQRRHPRTHFSLFGAMSFSDGVAIPCVTRDLSQSGIALTAPQDRAPGEKVTLRLDRLGVVKGHIVRVFDGGFAIALDGEPEDLLDFARRLDGLYAASPLSLIEAPVHTRFADLSPELDATATLGGEDVAGHMPAHMTRGTTGEIELQFRRSNAA